MADKYKRYYRGDGFVPEGRAGEPKAFGGLPYMHVWYTDRIFFSHCGDDGSKPPSQLRACEKLMERLREAGEITSRRAPETVLYERVQYVYYRDGMFFTTKRQRNAQKSGSYASLALLDGTITTCYPQWQAKRGIPDATIRCESGRPVEVTVYGETFEVTDDSWPTMESFLGLDMAWKPERYRRLTA